MNELSQHLLLELERLRRRMQRLADREERERALDAAIERQREARRLSAEEETE